MSASDQTSKSSSQKLSVVVVMLAGREYLVRCLAELDRQVGVERPEIIVPHDEKLTNVAALREQFTQVRFVSDAGQRSYAQLRSLGFRSATGEIIALTEDHCSPAQDWCATLLALHEGSYAAVGGSVDKSGPDTALNWAIYLSDFGRYMNPVPEGPAGYLTDCNVSYKRSALEAVASLWQSEFHETTVNWALQAKGYLLLLSPRVVVQQQRSLELGYALRERYEFGRLFASTRVAAGTALQRAAYAAASFLLPGVLIGRVVKNVGQKRRALQPFARSLPLILLVNVVWAWGEFVGYITGRAGPAAVPALSRADAASSPS